MSSVLMYYLNLLAIHIMQVLHSTDEETEAWGYNLSKVTTVGTSEKEPRTQTQTVSGQVCTLTTMFQCLLPLQLGEDGTQ